MEMSKRLIRLFGFIIEIIFIGLLIYLSSIGDSIDVYMSMGMGFMFSLMVIVVSNVYKSKLFLIKGVLFTYIIYSLYMTFDDPTLILTVITAISLLFINAYKRKG